MYFISVIHKSSLIYNYVFNYYTYLNYVYIAYIPKIININIQFDIFGDHTFPHIYSSYNYLSYYLIKSV